MKINFEKLYLLLLPTFLRVLSIKVFLSPIFKCLNYIYEEYQKYTEQKNYELNVTPQVWSLEKMLNDIICGGLRLITISDASRKPIFYFFRDTDNKDVYFGVNPQIHFFQADTAGYSETFIVNVPSRFLNREPQIKALLNKYKLLSKTYRINYI